MNKKGATELSLTTIIVLIIIGLLLIFFMLKAIFWMVDDINFNPETDVCINQREYDAHFGERVINSLGGYDTFQENYNAKYGEEEPLFDCSKFSEKIREDFVYEEGLFCSVCYEWREKTKCELNPEAEGCVCDEWFIRYGEKTCYSKQEISEYCADYFNTSIDLIIVNSDSCQFDNKSNKWSIDGLWLDCVQAHEPNECEKANLHYILDCERGCLDEYLKCIYPCQNYSQGSGGGALEEPICRLKTIDDYSCDELLGQIWLEEWYCPSKDCWGQECFDNLGIFETCGNDNDIFYLGAITIKDLKQIYLDKECEL